MGTKREGDELDSKAGFRFDALRSIFDWSDSDWLNEPYASF